tara:strand:- start:1473 stop:1775 length:303 start_codon:yes stop_codon:yes gene_type:complete
MGEKRGETGKLEMDFNPNGVLEVYLPKLEKWYRVTERDFRAFNGKRRITSPIEVLKGENARQITEEYFGLVYNWGSNTIIPFINSGKIENSSRRGSTETT